MEIDERIANTRNFSQIFDLVKEVVMDHTGLEQAGLMVGVADLGMATNGFVGAFYSLNANTIVINKRPIESLLKRNPDIFKYYLFHLLLHEYVHSIGVYDEQMTRQLVYEICNAYFGGEHILTELSTGMEKFLPNFIYPGADFNPPVFDLQYLPGIDRKNTSYIN